MRTCPDCGERVYSLGCTNCNEVAYIEEQERLNALYGYDNGHGDACPQHPANRGRAWSSGRPCVCGREVN